ncbi:MAG: TIGR03619 family F420-dependent LLM class oxidoreductase [Chloroflexi bacterium]|nr:TIGR03619 family F420-dependent LLM class oxidoreductase [Chloroflexota bacterium]
MADTPLHFALLTPIVTLLPRRGPTWEADGGPEDLRQIALAADRLGYHHLTCSEHVGIPTEVAKVRGARYYDPLATFGFMAAITQRVRFLTHVIVLPYHHPLAVAKRYGTLDRMSGGRLILGVGVGSLREEFELLDAAFDQRADLYTDGLKALRAALGKRQPVYHGEHYRFDDFIIDPWAVQERMPIWLGGRTPLSLRRALAAADGWDPFGMDIDRLGELLAQAREWPEWRQRDEPFDVALAPEPLYDVTDQQQRSDLIDLVARYQAAGATMLNMSFRSSNLDHYLEQLGVFAESVVPRFA